MTIRFHGLQLTDAKNESKEKELKKKKQLRIVKLK